MMHALIGRGLEAGSACVAMGWLLGRGALVALACMKQRSASRRASVAGAVLVALLCFPLVPLGFPRIAVPMLPPRVAPPASIPQFPPAAATAKAGGPHLSAPEDSNEQSSIKEGQPMASPVSNPWPDRLRQGFLVLLLSLWGVGAAFRWISILAGGWALRRLRMGARVVEPGEPLAEALREARRRSGYGGTIQLSLHDRIDVPATWGWWKPIIVCPISSQGWPMEKQVAALLHEIAHIERRDFLTQTMGRLAEALYWFLPVVRRLLERWRLEAEQACDDLVISRGVRGKDYGLFLLDVMRDGLAGAGMAALGLTMVRPSTLDRRVAAILDPSRPRGAVRFARQVVIAGVLLIGAGLAVSCKPVPAQAKPPVSQPDETMTTVTLRAVAPDGARWERLAIQGDSQRSWSPSSDGQSLQARLSHQSNDYRVVGRTYNFRVVGKTGSGKIYFSQPQALAVKSAAPIDLTVATLPAYRLRGNLDAAIPRPVRNGRVYACVTTASIDPTPGWFVWNSSAEIQPDGTFEFTDLPQSAEPTERFRFHLGPLELLALCDGYASKPPAGPSKEYAAIAQMFTPPIAQPLSLAMEPTGSVRVRVLDPDGQPLAGAKVVFLPNATFQLMTMMPMKGLRNSQQEFFPKPQESAPVNPTESYQAKTDPDGIAVVTGLPAGTEPYVVEGTPYDVPFRLRSGQPASNPLYAQNAVVLTKAGRQVATEIRMAPKMTAMAIPHGVSPNGKYIVRVEPQSFNPTSFYPQMVVVRDAATGALVGSSVPPENSQRQVNLILPSDLVRVAWSPDSSFFVFSVLHKGYLDLMVNSLGKEGGLTMSTLSGAYGSYGGGILSYDFVGPKTVRMQVQVEPGKPYFTYFTVEASGQVQGGAKPTE